MRRRNRVCRWPVSARSLSGKEPDKAAAESEQRRQAKLTRSPMDRQARGYWTKG